MQRAGTWKDKPEAAVYPPPNQGKQRILYQHPSEGKASKERGTAETSLCELGENTFPLFYVSLFQIVVMVSLRQLCKGCMKIKA